MTNIGYQHIIDIINERKVKNIPPDMTVDQLNCWLAGYCACRIDTLDILEKLIAQNERG